MGGNVCIEPRSEKAVKIKLSNDLNNQHEYTFDRIINEYVSQSQVFDIVAKPVIESVMKGFNGTIFCYGQTSSG